MAAYAANPGEFTFGERLGLVFIVETACLSAAAVCALLAYIAYGAVKIIPGSSRKWRTGTHVHFYFLSLLVSDLIQAIGGIMDIRWIVKSNVEGGSFCTAQGALKQIGDVGVALASMAIAFHTFAVLVFRWRPDASPKVAFAILGAIWTFIALIIGLGLGTHKGEDYYGNTQYWCWITSRYPAERIALEYFWMWFAALLNIALYVPLAFVLKGYIIIDGLKVRVPRREERSHLNMTSSNGMKDAGRLAMEMLFYPAVYTITVLPIAVVRWRAFYSDDVPFAATIVADVLFASSGVLNVVLFAITRPALLPTRERRGGGSYPDTTVLSEVITTSRGHARSMSEPRDGEEEDWSDTVRRTQSFSHPDLKPVPLEEGLPHIRPGTPIAV
ncbi:hypothetical protein GLOTRDRAFT_135219 [Gloeophyllum trabeum ATCC 11539]|uniref:G-protein coupled receptors family 1 profile domain-containing protein n=1 Tax=Gloeophyllum trabeum (strain ATCC 11539 / FP-39264 / Madison 617) TaxID=670483 RepID=S7QMC4_GLOTA|nr:uncharacterized protein GLOTRDRAFT_135219 [Gloeophyllum trabeum ATCC 11539]EPQ60547.1 hypothetical protein GLOTRDRAFT_135219 [Gloeophyllum trabeum ATCC 11539]